MSQRAILEGTCPPAQSRESTTRRAEGEEMKNSDPQEMLGNTQEVGDEPIPPSDQVMGVGSP